MIEQLSVAPEQVTVTSKELEREDWLKRYREAWASEIASKFHDNWRRGRLQEDGSYKPRIKKTKDETWITAHGTDEVDIANTDYKELPLDWQEENQAAARVIYDLIDNHRTRGMVVGAAENPSQAGNQVHDAWLERNDWAAGGELDTAFDKLPHEEQVKDIEQVEIGGKEMGFLEKRAA